MHPNAAIDEFILKNPELVHNYSRNEEYDEQDEYEREHH